jgi:hypothetical protein
VPLFAVTIMKVSLSSLVRFFRDFMSEKERKENGWESSQFWRRVSFRYVR